MPYHTTDKKDKSMTLQDAMKKFNDMKNKPKPMNKPSTMLNKLQKEFMKKHKMSKIHNEMMIKLMKMGYCIEQAHKLSHKVVGS